MERGTSTFVKAMSIILLASCVAAGTIGCAESPTPHATTPSKSRLALRPQDCGGVRLQRGQFVEKVDGDYQPVVFARPMPYRGIPAVFHLGDIVPVGKFVTEEGRPVSGQVVLDCDRGIVTFLPQPLLAEPPPQ